MKNDEIKVLLKKHLISDEIYVTGNNGHYQIVVVSKQFAGMNRVKKQQMVYAPLTEYISSNCIHAISIKTYTPEEWKLDRQLNNFKY